MRSIRIIISSVLLSGFALLSAAEVETVPFSAFAENKETAVTAGQTVDYGRFTIAPPKNVQWKIVPGKQKENEAFWAVIDEASILHTTIGMVKLSQPDISLKQFASGKKLEHLRKAFEHQVKANGGKDKRVQHIRCSSAIKTINGRKGIILTISGVDTASSHSKNGTHFKLFVKNFIIVTSDDRMLTIAVTERFPQASGVMNHAAVDAFFKAVKLK
jgi:hypothetical protein